MRLIFARRALRQRIVALAGAYAIAFAGVIASFGAAQAAAAAAQSDVVICHSSGADQQAPASDQGDGKLCADCCIGCLTLMAALPSPSAKIIPVPQSSHNVALPAITVLAGGPAGKSHQSRAPPRAA